jgi:hypothetical protein
LWTLTSTNAPLPPPTPSPTPTPPTPTSDNLSFITVTETEPATIPPEVTAHLRATNSTYFAYTVAMVGDPSPPKNALTWIGLSAGKPLPYSFLARSDGSIIWQGTTPTTAAAILKILTPSPTLPQRPDCRPGFSCPLRLRGEP